MLRTGLLVVASLALSPFPAGAAGVVGTGTPASAPTTAGYLRVYPGGTPAPATSTLNYAPGQTRANNATLSLGPAGDLAVFCGQVTGSAHLILDISGYLE